MKKESMQKGFTLVELAIVMTIIGLLIGGVLKGQELIFNARAQSTIEEVQSYQAASQTFRDKHSQLPGDMANATRKLSNCTAAVGCANGNADNIIGDVPPTSGPPWQRHNFNRDQAINAAPENETMLFWKHLALSDIISGVSPIGDMNNPIWGETHPISSMGIGGYHIMTQTNNVRLWQGADYEERPIGLGHYIRLQAPISGTPLAGPGKGSISDYRAEYIDRKMDDGDTTTGNVLAMKSGWAVCKPPENTWGMQCSSTTNDCGMMFKLQ